MSLQMRLMILFFNGLDQSRDSYLERLQKGHARGALSRIYNYSWLVCNYIKNRNYWLCFHCHIRKKLGGEYDAGLTSAEATHLTECVPGHSVGAQEPLRRSRDPDQASIVTLMRDSGVEVSQEVANETSSSFTKRKFQDALMDQIDANN